MAHVLRSGQVEVAEGFPVAVRPDALAVAALLPPPEYDMWSSGESVLVGQERVTIPYRIYNPLPPARNVDRLRPTAVTIYRCVYSRHHDGRVREQHIRALVGNKELWVTPISSNRSVSMSSRYLSSSLTWSKVSTSANPRTASLATFAATNPDFLQLTEQRATSYWNCYYRSEFSTRAEFPAIRALATIRRLQPADG